jgi:N-acyl homoserine lactone hydrolase
MKRTTYRIKKSIYSSWDEVLSNPRPVTLHSFQTGEVEIPLRGTINPEHPHAGQLPDEKIKVPIVFHVISHKEKGDYLIDAGLDGSYIEDPKGLVHGVLARKISEEFYLENNHNTAYYLKKYSFKPKAIFLSHLHADHVAGIRETPNIPIVISRNEKFAEDKYLLLSECFKDVKELYEIDFAQANLLPPLGICADLLGDGSLWTIQTPGHTTGHLSFLINSKEGPILLTADACFIRDGLERGVASSIYTWNIVKAQKSLNQLLKFIDQYPQVRVGAGHEALK